MLPVMPQHKYTWSFAFRYMLAFLKVDCKIFYGKGTFKSPCFYILPRWYLVFLRESPCFLNSHLMDHSHHVFIDCFWFPGGCFRLLLVLVCRVDNCTITLSGGRLLFIQLVLHGCLMITQSPPSSSSPVSICSSSWWERRSPLILSTTGVHYLAL